MLPPAAFASIHSVALSFSARRMQLCHVLFFLKVRPWLATHHTSVWVKFAVVFCTCICSSCICTFAVVFSIDSLVDNAPCNSVVSAHSFCRTCLCSSCTCSFFSKCFPGWQRTMHQSGLSLLLFFCTLICS